MLRRDRARGARDADCAAEAVGCDHQEPDPETDVTAREAVDRTAGPGDRPATAGGAALPLQAETQRRRAGPHAPPAAQRPAAVRATGDRRPAPGARRGSR